MTPEESLLKINWYRSPVDRKILAQLNQRSDWKGLLQTLGHLGLLVLTGTAAWVAFDRSAWGVFVLVVYLHGMFFAFLLNAFHEFVHRSVFKTKILNSFFLYLVSFLSWNNPVYFWASHQRHHRYTLHPPEDMEVVLPQQLRLKDFIRILVVSPWDFFARLKSYIRHSAGRLDGGWEQALFPASAVNLRRQLIVWSRLHLAGHLVILAVSIAFKWWSLPLLITFAPFYGGGLQYLCNNTQHTGLQDNVPDFRLCTRTILLNPFLQFLYWHMNFHIEHHMYAAVPCYNLPRLHQVIRNDLPESPAGLNAAWKHIIMILKQQAVDPSYQFVAELPD